jgi:hypothetical protein
VNGVPADGDDLGRMMAGVKYNGMTDHETEEN